MLLTPHPIQKKSEILIDIEIEIERQRRHHRRRRRRHRRRRHHRRRQLETIKSLNGAADEKSSIIAVANCIIAF